MLILLSRCAPSAPVQTGFDYAVFPFFHLDSFDYHIFRQFGEKTALHGFSGSASLSHTFQKFRVTCPAGFLFTIVRATRGGTRKASETTSPSPQSGSKSKKQKSEAALPPRAMPTDYLKLLPFDSDALAKEGAALADEAEKLYANILLSGSSRSVLPGIYFLDLKHTPSYEQLARIAELLVKIFECASGDIVGEARTAKALSHVLKKLVKLSDLPPHGAPNRFTIAWRPIYSCLLRVVLRGATWESAADAEADQIIGSEAVKYHYKSLLSLARRARSFFPAEAAEEILAELRPYFCPHDERHFFRSAALLYWFLPDHMADPGATLVELIGVWDLISHGHEWNMVWFTIFSRMMRHNPEHVTGPIQPFLPRMFDVILRTIGVPTGKAAAQKPDFGSWPEDLKWLLEGKGAKKDSVRKFVRMAVFSIGPNSATMGMIEELIGYTKPFFHPLNEGEHKSPLNHLMSLLCLNYSKRVGIEAGKHSVKKPWNSHYRVSASDSERIVNLLLPLCQTAFQSKSDGTQFLVCQAMKDLASVCPELVMPQITGMILPALDNVMRPHEVMGAIILTSTMASELIKVDGGLDLIGQVLRMTVPGIDLNDPSKTMYTFRMLMSVLNQVPLMDPADLPHGVPKPEMLYGLQEWVVEIIDRIFSVLENVPSLKKGFHMGQILSATIGRFFDVFLQQMSPKLHAAALNRIVRKVTQSIIPAAQKYIGSIVDSAVFSCPPDGLKALIPALCDKVLPNGSLNASESEAVYYTHMLGHAVRRAGPHSAPYAERIEAVVGVVAMHSEKEYYKQGQKLLRKYLKGLLNVVPTDNRSLPPSMWGCDKITDFYAACGTVVSPDKSEVTWRVPAKECLARARSIVDKFVGPALSSVSGDAAPGEMRVALSCVSNIVRGASAIFSPKDAPSLGSWDGTADEGDDAPDADHEDGEDGCAGSHLLRLVSSDGDGGWADATRGRMEEALIAFCKKHANAENPDVTTLKQAVRLVECFLSCNGSSPGLSGKKKATCNYNKNVYRDWSKGPGRHFRDYSVVRSYALLLRREDRGMMEETQGTGELVDALISLCTHEYSLVRKKAQKSLPKVLKRYPRMGHKVVVTALKVISDPASTKGALNGAIFTIQNAWGLRKVARHWGLTSSFITALVGARSVEDSKVQIRLAELWNSFVPHCFPNPLRGPAHPEGLVSHPAVARSAGAGAQAVFSRGEKALERRRESCVRHYSELTEMLEGAMLGTGKDGVLHWRFVILAGSALAMLVRRDAPGGKCFAEGFIKRLDSELLALRQLCRIVIPSLQVSERLGRAEGGDEDGMDVDCATPSAAGGGDVTMGGGDVLPMSTFEQDLGSDAEYVDQLWLGWNVPIAASDSTFVKLSHTGSPSSDDKGWAVVSNFTKAVITAFADQEFVAKACDRMSQDHRLNGDERAEQATSGFPGMPVASAAVSKAAAGRFALPGNFSDKAFSVDNMLTFKVVAQSGGIKACEHLWGVLDKAIKATSDQEQQCLAAEMVAGLVKGGMAWEGEYAESLKARLAPIISTALGGASPESLPYWMDALRHIGIQKDPRRLRWIVDIVASLTPEEGSGSPAQLRALKLYKAFAIEFGWRGMTLHNACAPTIRRLMCGESKSVREEAARCLAILSRATQPSMPRGPVRPLPPTEVHTSSTLSSAWLKDEAASLLASYTADSAPAAGTPENKALMSRIEGVVYYYIHATRLGWGTSVVETSVGALLLMLAIQEDSDRELAQVGKMGYELFATSLPNAAVASKLIDTATEVFSTNKSWRVRNGCIDFIREAGHTCVLHAEIRTRVAQFIQENGLVDNVPEVRQNSCTSLAGFLRMSTSEHVASIIANAPKPKRRGAKAKDDKSDEERAAMLIRRHAKVLGIASCVLSHPTELPEWMCDAVTALCRLQGEETMISSSISKTVCDFKKSHQDVWELVKTTWSEDSLQLLSDISGTQSYYS